MFDLTLHDVRLPDAPETRLDVAIKDGIIAEVRPDLPEGTDARHMAGRLVLPGFCETHIHLDKSCILDRCTMNGGLQEAIAEVAALKSAFTVEGVADRAARTLRKCVVNGTTAMRTHVEVDPVIGLTGLEGVRRAVADWSWAIDVEVCVFPQEGLLNNPGTDALMVEALRSGAARTVGAAPYTDSDPHGQIDRVFEMAREFDVDIDMHLDFGAGAGGLDVEHVARRTEEHGWGGRVTVGHVSRFAGLSPERFRELARRLAHVGVAVTVLPSTDLFLMHRDHAADLDPARGVTPVHRMRDAGVRCSLSTNNVLNPFTPFGDCSLLRMANLYANVAQVGSREAMADCFAMVSSEAARILKREPYGVAVGNPADLVIIDAADPAMAVAELAQPMLGFRRGRQTFSHALPELSAPPR